MIACVRRNPVFYLLGVLATAFVTIAWIRVTADGVAGSDQMATFALSVFALMATFFCSGVSGGTQSASGWGSLPDRVAAVPAFAADAADDDMMPKDCPQPAGGQTEAERTAQRRQEIERKRVAEELMKRDGMVKRNIIRPPYRPKERRFNPPNPTNYVPRRAYEVVGNNNPQCTWVPPGTSVEYFRNADGSMVRTDGGPANCNDLGAPVPKTQPPSPEDVAQAAVEEEEEAAEDATQPWYRRCCCPCCGQSPCGCGGGENEGGKRCLCFMRLPPDPCDLNVLGGLVVSMAIAASAVGVANNFIGPKMVPCPSAKFAHLMSLVAVTVGLGQSIQSLLFGIKRRRC